MSDGTVLILICVALLTGMVLGGQIRGAWVRKYDLPREQALRRDWRQAADLLADIYDFVVESGAIEGPWLHAAAWHARMSHRLRACEAERAATKDTP